MKLLRRQMGITQEELAWRSKLHRTYIADIERGARNVTLRSIENLAKALQVSVAHLMTCASVPGALGTDGAGVALPARPGEVLLVEDNEEDAVLTQRAFRHARMTNPLRVLPTAEDAWDYLCGLGDFAAAGAARPALILLDLNLPGMSGLELLRQLKADSGLRTIPVVMLTVSCSDQPIVECGRLGAANYIVKPLSFESFLRLAPRLNLQFTLAPLEGGPR